MAAYFNEGKVKTKETVLLFGLFCVVFGAKILTISIYGNVVPFWDQWDADPGIVYLPYFEGHLSLDMLISSHNEHRVFFSRVLSLAELLAAGEWNPILQMIVNAALHSIVIVLLTWGFIRALPDEDRFPLVVLSAIIFSLPIGHEN